MDFQQLKIFLKLACLKNFSRTAEAMYISQPSASSRIKGLEEELGVTLFDRPHPRELTLTVEGRLFLDYAQSIVNLYEEALDHLHRKNAPPEGLVRLGASTVPGIYLLPPLLASFRKAEIGVEINLEIIDTTRVIEKVLDYSVDLGFVGSLRQDERLDYHAFAADRLIVITPPGLLLAGSNDKKPGYKGEISIEECLPCPLLVREKGSATREMLEKTLSDRGLTLKDFSSVTCMDSLEAIKQGVRHGLGISLVSDHTAADYIHFGLVDAYRMSSFRLERSLYLIRHRSRVLSRATAKLRAFIIETTKKNSSLEVDK